MPELEHIYGSTRPPPVQRRRVGPDGGPISRRFSKTTNRDRAIKRHAQWSGGSKSDKTGKRGNLPSALERGIKGLWDTGKEGIYGLGHAALKGLKATTSAYAEGQEARRDDKKWTLGGDPLDINKGSMADKWMQTQILPEYRDEYERERDKRNLHWTELSKFTGPDTVGLAERINVLNNLTPERLERYSPIKQRNILESIVNPAEADAFRRSDVGQEGIVNNAMLMDYINRAKDLYGDGGLPSIAVDDEIMNYRDPIRDMVAPTSTGGTPRGTFLDQREYNRMDLDDQMNIKTSVLPPTYQQVYGDPMDNIQLGEPGNNPLSHLLTSMYPNYSDFAGTDRAKTYGLENMNERELMEFGYKNPVVAPMFGFDPENYPDYGY